MTLINGEQIRKLEEQNAALESELVAVKAAADKMRFKGAIVSNICYNIGQNHSDAEQILQAVKEYDEEARKFRDASNLGPQHHLRQVRADAGRDAIKAVLNLPTFTARDGSWLFKAIALDRVLPFANQYHASILAGKE